MLKWKLWTLAAVTVAPLILAGCRPATAQKDARTETPLVLVATVHPAGASERGFTGVVSARVQSDLGFRVSGKVIERLVETGQSVKGGQPLMRIDRTDYEHAITAQNHKVEAAKELADQTAADERRYRGLVATGAASASTYDQMKAAANAARDQLAAVEAQSRVVKNEGDYTTLFADVDGIVVDTLAEPGQVVAAGQTVVKLAHSGPREAAVDLPETVRPAIGSLAEAALYGLPGSRNTARLRQLSDAADPLTRTFAARYVLEGAAVQAPIGATVTVYLVGKQSRHDFEVPIGAIFDPGSGSGVWIVNTGTSSVSFRQVQILQLGEEVATVSGGVERGDQVVALAPHVLHENERVRIEELKAAR